MSEHDEHSEKHSTAATCKSPARHLKRYGRYAIRDVMVATRTRTLSFSHRHAAISALAIRTISLSSSEDDASGIYFYAAGPA